MKKAIVFTFIIAWIVSFSAVSQSKYFTRNGKIIFNATFAPEDSDVMWASVLRSAPDGSIDSSFSSELHGILRSIAIQSNGRILAAGELFTQEGRRYALDRLLSDGSPDPEFHQTGFVTNGDAWTMTTQPDDKILVAGASKNGLSAGSNR